MKGQPLVSLIVAGLAGTAIWALSSRVTGHKEPWDADGFYYIAALVTVGLISGAITPGPLCSDRLRATSPVNSSVMPLNHPYAST